MTAHMFGPISEGRNKGYLTDTLTILNWFSSLKFSKVNGADVTFASLFPTRNAPFAHYSKS